MKASRAAIKTAKAVKSVEARLELLETQGSEIYALLANAFGILEAAEERAVKESSVAVPLPKAETVRKRGGA